MCAVAALWRFCWQHDARKAVGSDHVQNGVGATDQLFRTVVLEALKSTQNGSPAPIYGGALGRGRTCC